MTAATVTTTGATLSGGSHLHARHWPTTGPPEPRGAGLPLHGRLQSIQKQDSVSWRGGIGIFERYPRPGGGRRWANAPVLFAPFAAQPDDGPHGLILAAECAPDGSVALFRGKARVTGLRMDLDPDSELTPSAAELAAALNIGDCIQLSWDSEGLRQARAFDPSSGEIIWVGPQNRSDRDWWLDGTSAGDIPADAPRHVERPVTLPASEIDHNGWRGRPISHRAYKPSMDATGPGIADPVAVKAAARRGADEIGQFRPLQPERADC